MDSRAQASLEYLMTYGWVLVLIATVLGVLVFIVSSPASQASFSSSDPAKIMVKAGAIEDTDAVAKLTNATGGKINISNIAATGDSYSTCTINEETTDIDIPAGATMELNCPLSGQDPTGAVTITYTDFAGLQRDVIIRIAGGTGAGGTAPTCGDGTCSAGETCAADCSTETHCSDGVDNDEDTQTDCDDEDCTEDPACTGCTSGGSGTEADPYRVTNAAELQAIKDDLDAWYELCQDIDASETSTWNGGAGFDPIGDNASPFTGNFDGKGYKITGLYINRPSENQVGLFGYVSEGEIRSIGLENVDVTGDYDVGGLAGVVTYIIFPDAIIDHAYSTGTVRGVNYQVGGLIGSNGGGLITNCYSEANVEGDQVIGGLMGFDWGTVTNCYATGNITGNVFIGGLIGFEYGDDVTNCYSSGNVTGTGSNVGGLIGAGGPPTNSYYPGDDITCTGCTNNLGETTKANLQSQSWLTTPPNDWDFITIWNINDGTSYPFLR